jgi:hypothetical protein
VRNDDWDEDGGEEPEATWAVPAPVAPTPAPPPDAPAPVAEAEAETAPTPRPKPPLSAVLPIYIIGIVSVSLICLMFAIVMALIITR